MVYVLFVINCLIYIVSGIVANGFEDNKRAIISWIIFTVGLALSLYICSIINGGSLN